MCQILPPLCLRDHPLMPLPKRVCSQDINGRIVGGSASNRRCAYVGASSVWQLETCATRLPGALCEPRIDTSVKVNFGPKAAAGWLQDRGQGFGPGRGLSYGWSCNLPTPAVSYNMLSPGMVGFVDEVGMSHVVPGGAAPVTLWRVSNKGYTGWRPAIWELKLFADKVCVRARVCVCVCVRARVCVHARRKAPSDAF